MQSSPSRQRPVPATHYPSSLNAIVRDSQCWHFKVFFPQIDMPEDIRGLGECIDRVTHPDGERASD